MSTPSETPVTTEAPQEPAQPKEQKTYYPFSTVAIGPSSFRIYTEQPITQDADLEPPANSSPWEVPAPAKGTAYYQADDSGFWTLAWDVRSMSLATLKDLVTQSSSLVLESQVAGLNSAYPASERATWPQQVADASAVLAGQPSTLLAALATARGVDVKVVAQKVLDKNTAYQQSYATALSTFQKARDAISAAKSPADLPTFALTDVMRYKP